MQSIVLSMCVVSVRQSFICVCASQAETGTITVVAV